MHETIVALFAGEWPLWFEMQSTMHRDGCLVSRYVQTEPVPTVREHG